MKKDEAGKDKIKNLQNKLKMKSETVPVGDLLAVHNEKARKVEETSNAL